VRRWERVGRRKSPYLFLAVAIADRERRLASRDGAPPGACNGQSRFYFLETTIDAIVFFEALRPIGRSWEGAGFLAADAEEKLKNCALGLVSSYNPSKSHTILQMAFRRAQALPRKGTEKG
jgi:hypothetical protein